MHVLQVARTPRWDVQERWAKFGLRTSYVPANQFLASLVEDPHFRSLTVDAVAFVTYDGPLNDRALADRFLTSDAINLTRRLRQLPEDLAMRDGRRWSAIPSAVLVPPTDRYTFRDRAEYGYGDLQIPAELRDVALIPLHPDTNFGAEKLKGAITTYRQAVLAELDSLGFVVTYDAGRYRLGPALRPRVELSGHYYFGVADRRE
jgi:hypothetical protein